MLITPNALGKANVATSTLSRWVAGLLLGIAIHGFARADEADPREIKPVEKIKIIIYTLSGFMAAFAGLILAARFGSTRPDIGTGLELSVITAVVLGGVDKGNDYSLLMDLVTEKVKAIVCMGIDNTKIHQAFDGKVNSIVDTASAEDAVKAAFHLAAPGDVVLLSPACASFDLFKNYEDRGNQFKEAVRNL